RTSVRHAPAERAERARHNPSQPALHHPAEALCPVPDRAPGGRGAIPGARLPGRSRIARRRGDDDQFHFLGAQHAELLAGEALEVAVVGLEPGDLCPEGRVLDAQFLAVTLEARRLARQRVGAEILRAEGDHHPPGETAEGDHQEARPERDGREPIPATPGPGSSDGARRGLIPARRTGPPAPLAVGADRQALGAAPATPARARAPSHRRVSRPTATSGALGVRRRNGAMSALRETSATLRAYGPRPTRLRRRLQTGVRVPSRWRWNHARAT